MALYRLGPPATTTLLVFQSYTVRGDVIVGGRRLGLAASGPYQGPTRFSTVQPAPAQASQRLAVMGAPPWRRVAEAAEAAEAHLRNIHPAMSVVRENVGTTFSRRRAARGRRPARRGSALDRSKLCAKYTDGGRADLLGLRRE